MSRPNQFGKVTKNRNWERNKLVSVDASAEGIIWFVYTLDTGKRAYVRSSSDLVI